MTPEVKKRIEQIRQGIVPEGYVKDKDGIYPRDWASKKIGQWLKLAERPIVLQDEEEYQLVTIRRGFGGVDSRGSFLGKNVLVKNYFIVKTGDFIISKRQIAHGACGIVPPELDGAVVSNEYNVFLPQDGTNIQMFNLMMQLPHYKRLFYLMSDGVHIEKLLFKTQDWMKRTLAMPLLKEQKKIAEILATQDKAIELQGRKIEELKRFKQGCLERMFPRKGQKVPEKRFPGFTDDWEQRKAKELFVSTADKGYPELPVLSATQDRGMIRRDENSINIFHDKKNEAGYKRVLPGQFVIHLRSFQGGFAHSAIEGITSPAYTVFGFSEPEKHDSEYWKYVFTSKSFIQRLETVTYGIRDGRSISYEEFLTLGFVYPSKAEQTAIARYLDKLSDLITLHQRKLEEMKRQKKALMQLLLTGIVRV